MTTPEETQQPEGPAAENAAAKNSLAERFQAKRFLRGYFMIAAAALGIAAGAVADKINSAKPAMDEEQERLTAVFSPAGDAIRKKPVYGDFEHEFNPFIRHHDMMKDTANVTALKTWLSRLDPLMDKAPLARLEGLRRLVQDSVRYSYEERLYGRREYMAAPLQTIQAKYGDCDDFAFLFYIGARYLKFPEEKCFIMQVSSDGGPMIDHAVAVVDTSAAGDKPYQSRNMFILDNGGPLLHLEDANFMPFVLTNREGSHIVMQGARAFYAHEKSDLREMGARDYIKSRIDRIKPKTEAKGAQP